MEFVQPIRDKKQIESLKTYLKGLNLRDYCLFTLGINSALRISDLLKLKIVDILDENSKLRDRICMRENKTNKTKDFPLSDTAKKALLDYLKSRPIIIPNDPLFLSRKKQGVLQRDQAYKVINKAARAIGMTERIGTHTMRKTFAYQAIKAGMSLTVVQKLLNHSSPAVTLAYAGITQDELDQVYLKLNL